MSNSIHPLGDARYHRYKVTMEIIKTSTVEVLARDETHAQNIALLRHNRDQVKYTSRVRFVETVKGEQVTL